jgi:hypothetical protein
MSLVGLSANGMSAIASGPAADCTELRTPLPEAPARPGTQDHKVLFCRTLLDTFNPYQPAVIDWPVPDAQSRDRLVGLPIWDIAVQTAGRAKPSA